MQCDLTVLWRSGRKDWSVDFMYLLHWIEAIDGVAEVLNAGMLVWGVGGLPCLAVDKVLQIESIGLYLVRIEPSLSAFHYKKMRRGCVHGLSHQRS